MKLAWSTVLASMLMVNIVWAQGDPELEKLKREAAREQEEELKGLPKRVSDLEKKVEKSKVGDSSSFRVYWGPGLTIESPDKAFKLAVGGRIYFHYHLHTFDDDMRTRLGQADADHETREGFKFRTTRFHMNGTIYQNVFYSNEWEWTAEGDINAKDIWIGIQGITIADMGTISMRFGHFKEAFSFETLTSSRYITFTERSLLKSAFVAEFNPGVILNSSWAGDVFTFSFSFTKEASDSVNSFSVTTDGRFNYSMRVTSSPYFEKNGAEMVHVGVGYRRSHHPSGGVAGVNREGVVTYSTKPESDVAATSITTGAILARADNRVGLELGGNWGSFNLSAEYIMVFVDRYSSPLDEPFFFGYYVEIAYFLTGEVRPYKRSTGTWDRVKPLKNFAFQDGGWGAWQVAFRYSYLDMEDSGIPNPAATVGEPIVQQYTFGINWYLNPSARIMFDFSILTPCGDFNAAVQEGDGQMFLLTIRWQVDF
jgi:phosphate-selective porin OprO/OprP